MLPIDLSGDLVAQTPLWASVVGQVLIVIGALLFSTAAIGVIRLPDIYTRASAISTAAGSGLAMIVTGTFFFVPGLDNAVKLVIAVILQLVASAVGSMTIEYRPMACRFDPSAPIPQEVWDELASRTIHR